ncbi:hypothetical protein GIB67_025917 [Kingdonia uniflora]|uniref:Uncharacterized protein n=1 Tax=Kingdonia uniflora TaxID=39325 RepID=A0A7J7NZK8_9MAGN|nr:hypothetical protein GIB67_025917 [Kingdonia uniflora]
MSRLKVVFDPYSSLFLLLLIYILLSPSIWSTQLSYLSVELVSICNQVISVSLIGGGFAYFRRSWHLFLQIQKIGN